MVLLNVEWMKWNFILLRCGNVVRVTARTCRHDVIGHCTFKRGSTIYSVLFYMCAYFSSIHHLAEWMECPISTGAQRLCVSKPLECIQEMTTSPLFPSSSFIHFLSLLNTEKYKSKYPFETILYTCIITILFVLMTSSNQHSVDFYKCNST